MPAYPLRANGPDLEVVALSFTGSTSPGTVYGKGVTVAHSGTTGRFNVTLDKPYNVLVAGSGSVAGNTPFDDTTVEVKATSGSAGTVQVWTGAAGSASNLTANDRVQVILVISRNSLND
jgi:hypothetical protein